MQRHVELHAKGYQWDTAVLTAFDENRTLGEIITEIASMLDWTRDKVRAKLNFGTRNVRMGEAARKGDITEKQIIIALQKHSDTLLESNDLEGAVAFVQAKKGLDSDGLEALYHETFTQNGDGELGENGTFKWGAELAAVAD